MPFNCQRFKNKLYRRTNFIKCVFCKKSLARNEATVEHVIPKSKGGLDRYENYHISCEPCNGERGNMDYDEFKSLKQKEIARKK